jgi:hypothetical protein
MEKQPADDFCTCGCHAAGSGIIHCFPCCAPCPHCNQDIRIARYQKHVAACEKDQGIKT